MTTDYDPIKWENWINSITKLSNEELEFELEKKRKEMYERADNENNNMTALEFLKSKGIIHRDQVALIITLGYGKKISIHSLMEEYAASRLEGDGWVSELRTFCEEEKIKAQQSFLDSDTEEEKD